MAELRTQDCINPELGALLMSYGLGTLSESDQIKFEEHLILCESCQNELNQASSSLKELSDNRLALINHLHKTGGDFESRLKNLDPASLRDHGSDIPKAHPYVNDNISRDLRRSNWRIYTGIGLAACLAMLLFYQFYPAESIQNNGIDQGKITESQRVLHKDSTDKFVTHNKHLELSTKVKLTYAVVSPRGTSSPNRIEFAKGMAAYNDDRYHEAGVWLDKARQLDSTDTEVLLYLGVSSYLANDLEKAQTALSECLAAKPRATRYLQAQWYLANTYLRTDSIPKCTELLNSIITAQELYSTEATELLKKISQFP